MRVLLLAPQPFYSERGTPISVENLIRVMSARGWQVDVLTYAQGSDLDLPGLTINRIPRIPGIPHVKPGFSMRKVICDAVMSVEAARLIRKNMYDLVHGLEEAVFIAAALRKLYGTPYVYDMDSLLSEQLIDQFPKLGPVRDWLRYMEEVAVSDSLGVVAVCESLAQAAENMSERPIVARLEDRTQLGPLIEGADSLRDMTGANQTIALYVGNLESYQGIDLLLDGFAKAVARVSDLSLVIIGGSDQDLWKYRQRAFVLGIGSDVFFLGPRPIEHLRGYLEQADVLISPRISGRNTPMKIYSFLDAGVALLATRSPTHVQVLDDEIACLFDPDPVSLANALVGLHESPASRERLGQAATARVAELYSERAYEEKAHRFLEQIEERVETSTD